MKKLLVERRYFLIVQVRLLSSWLPIESITQANQKVTFLSQVPSGENSSVDERPVVPINPPASSKTSVKLEPTIKRRQLGSIRLKHDVRWLYLSQMKDKLLGISKNFILCGQTAAG